MPTRARVSDRVRKHVSRGDTARNLRSGERSGRWAHLAGHRTSELTPLGGDVGQGEPNCASPPDISSRMAFGSLFGLGGRPPGPPVRSAFGRSRPRVAVGRGRGVRSTGPLGTCREPPNRGDAGRHRPVAWCGPVSHSRAQCAEIFVRVLVGGAPDTATSVAVADSLGARLSRRSASRLRALCCCAPRVGPTCRWRSVCVERAIRRRGGDTPAPLKVPAAQGAEPCLVATPGCPPHPRLDRARRPSRAIRVDLFRGASALLRSAGRAEPREARGHHPEPCTARGAWLAGRPGRRRDTGFSGMTGGDTGRVRVPRVRTSG